MEKLNLWCGETSSWNTEKKVIDAFKDSPLWAKWAAASNNPRRSEKELVNLINRLKIRHTEEAAKGTAAAAAALAAANGTAPPGGVMPVVGAVEGVCAFESEVVGQLQTIGQHAPHMPGHQMDVLQNIESMLQGYLQHTQLVLQDMQKQIKDGHESLRKQIQEGQVALQAMHVKQDKQAAEFMQRSLTVDSHNTRQQTRAARKQQTESRKTRK